MSAVFTVKPLPEIRFGVGKSKELASIIGRFGRSTLLLTGEGSFIRSTHWSYLQEALTSAGIDVLSERIAAEPSPDLIDGVVEKYRETEIPSVVAIGGGSVVDGGKAVAAMLPGGEEVTPFLEGVGSKSPDGRKIDFIAVPTTAGTGSEVTSNAVISRVGENGFKKSLRHDNFIPNIAVVDPLLSQGCPAGITRNCAMDAFTQLVEAYLSTKASPYTDGLVLGAIEKMKESFMPVCMGSRELSDRSSLCYAALISGIGLTNAGLGVIHGFASVIGGLYPVPHGVVCGTLMAVANEATLVKLRREDKGSVALPKYAELGKIFSDKEKKSSSYSQDYFIDMLKRITDEVGMNTLGEYGMTSEGLGTIVRQTQCKNNPIELEEEELLSILAARL